MGAPRSEKKTRNSLATRADQGAMSFELLDSEAVPLAALFVAYGIVEVVRRTPWVLRKLDRGGLRVRNLLTGRRSYLPFTRIASIDVERGNGLVLKDAGGRVLERVFFQTPEAAGQALSDIPRLAGRPLGACSALARNGLDLESWLARVRSLATPRGPYQSTHVEPPYALAVAEDELAPLGERAAAIYYLCCTGQAPAELLAKLDHETPPLIAVVASLAPGCGSLVPLAEDLVRYLSADDQRAFRTERERATQQDDTTMLSPSTRTT